MRRESAGRPRSGQATTGVERAPAEVARAFGSLENGRPLRTDEKAAQLRFVDVAWYGRVAPQVTSEDITW